MQEQYLNVQRTIYRNKRHFQYELFAGAKLILFPSPAAAADIAISNSENDIILSHIFQNGINGI